MNLDLVKQMIIRGEKAIVIALILPLLMVFSFVKEGVAAPSTDVTSQITMLIEGAEEVAAMDGSTLDLKRFKQEVQAWQKMYNQGSIDSITFLAGVDNYNSKLVEGNPLVNNLDILFVEREQYEKDHHNTANLFQKGEINDFKFNGGASLKIYSVATGKERTLFESRTGVIRDPELSFDATKVLFSFRANKDSYYHIYEIDIDGSNMKQLTFAKGISDIDPLYLPDGNIVFTSTREPKFCMCNRHIMGNLYRMESDGANIVQIGGSTLFEGHASLLNDGRILYDRWEYVDKNFGDAQGLWTVNPDGTRHAIYYGNNTPSPGGVIDARAIENSNLVTGIFGSCHDKSWGSVVILDRSRGIDGKAAVVQIWPKSSIDCMDRHHWDAFKSVKGRYEDPYPLSERFILVSKTIYWNEVRWSPLEYKMGIYLLDREGNEMKINCGGRSKFDPIPVVARAKPPIIPAKRDFTDSPGRFYVQNVYEGTHMEGVEKGSVKYMRVIESPEKKTWTQGFWQGQGTLAPGMNWSSFENKRILGTVPVEKDGSAYVEVESGKYVYFQLLDEDKKMIQTMRSGTMVMPNETNGCIGCHENRLTVPSNSANTPLALKGRPHKMEGWKGEIKKFSYMEHVQPIFDKNCVKCHDFEKGDKKPNADLVLAGDRNPWFNASYINLYVKGKVKLIGAGPADHQAAKSWGSHTSKLSTVVGSEHNGVNLTKEEIETIYTWLDLNGVYYSTYDSAYPDNPGGRSPLDNKELETLAKITGVNVDRLGSMHRKEVAQISFERPELSPCLNGIRDDKAKYNEAVALIQKGYKQLQKTPRADMKNFVPCQWHQDQLKKYDDLDKMERMSRVAIEQGTKVYDEGKL